MAKADVKEEAGSLPAQFQFFTEIGIINQLAVTLLEKQLPKGFLASHFSVLNHLVRLGGGDTPLGLANAFQVPKTTMTHTLLVLKKNGLVSLRPNPADGRSKQVFITPEGQQFHARAISALKPEIEILSRRFPPDFLEGLLSGLTEIREFLDNRRNL